MSSVPQPPTFAIDGRALGRRGLRTRQRLLDATVELLRARGLRDVRVVDIARCVDASPATFYQYFRSVEDAVLHLAAEAAEDLPAIVALIEGPWDTDDALERARRVVDGFLTHWEHHEAVLRIRNLASEEGDERFREMRLASLQPVTEGFEAAIAGAQASGSVSPSVNAYAGAAALVAMLERVGAYQAELVARGVSREDLVDTQAIILYQTVTGGAAP